MNRTNGVSTLTALMFPVAVIEQSRFTQDGDTIDRLCLDVLGHEVQLLVYNDNVHTVAVKFDDEVEQTNLIDAIEFVTARLQEYR